MSVVSVGLSGLPFISSCDSTRIQMAAKQINQSLTSLNCEIPYVIGNEYKNLTMSSDLGINIAQEDGKVLFKSNDNIIVYHYNESDKIEVKKIPNCKKAFNIFGSKLRKCLDENDVFNRGDIIYEYDSFMDGVPTFGYNMFTGYFNFFGYNHEDSLVISEYFAEKAKVQYIDYLYIPIFDYTVLHPIYSEYENSFKYFPNIGQSLENGVFAVRLVPKQNHNVRYNSADMKIKMINTFKSMGLSDFLNIKNINSSTLSDSNVIRSKLDNGIVTNIKVHNVKLNNKISMVDKSLQHILSTLNKKYLDETVVPEFDKLSNIFTRNYSIQLLKQHYLFTNEYNYDKFIKHCVYLLEVEITSEEKSLIGDKFANRYANKGVSSSCILPDDLRPVSSISGAPIDIIFSPFSVFSRMNISQILEAIVGKNIWMANNYIKSVKKPEACIESLFWINENIVKHFNDKNYYNNVKSLVMDMEKNESVANEFLDSVLKTNLFIEAPAFNQINTKSIVDNSIPMNEDLYLSKKLLKYMRQNLKLDTELTNSITDSITIPKILCAPIYMLKLYKLINHLVNSRDIGQVSNLTKLPTRGRASGGGSRIGQMEIEGIIAHGSTLALRELMTVKSDYEEGKDDLLDQLIRTCRYNFKTKDNTTSIIGGSKKVVQKFMEFLEL